MIYLIWEKPYKEEIMKKAKLAAAILTAGLALGACSGAGGSFQPTENSIYVTADGQLSTATIEAVSGESYTGEAFTAFVEQAVGTFNEEKGSASKARNEEGQAKLPAAVRSCTIEEGKASMILDYGDAQSVVDFSEESGIPITSLTVGPVGSGLPALKKADGSAADSGEAAGSGGMMVEAEGAVTIQTEGKILYITDGVTVVDDRTVRTPEGKSTVIFKK